MNVRVLGSYGGELGRYRSSAYLFEDTILLDAGGASAVLGAEEVRGLKAIVLTHAHADHIASIPFLLDNRIGAAPLDVYGLRETIAALRIHVFNNKIWPDFERIPDTRHPLLRYREVERERPFTLEGLRFTGIAVDHTVPTVGYLVENGASAVLFSSDTGPTTRIWEVAAGVEALRAITIEVSFPARLDRIAVLSKHLSTATISDELRKLPAGVRKYVNHLKPAFVEEITRELEPLFAGQADLGMLEQGRTYEF